MEYLHSYLPRDSTPAALQSRLRISMLNCSEQIKQIFKNSELGTRYTYIRRTLVMFLLQLDSKMSWSGKKIDMITWLE